MKFRCATPPTARRLNVAHISAESDATSRVRWGIKELQMAGFEGPQQARPALPHRSKTKSTPPPTPTFDQRRSENRLKKKATATLKCTQQVPACLAATPRSDAPRQMPHQKSSLKGSKRLDPQKTGQGVNDMYDIP